MPQNWDQHNPDELWLHQEEGSLLQHFQHSKTETAHLENGDRPPDNRRLRWLRGLRRSLHLRIRLRRFRTLHHQEWDLFNKWTLHHQVATSSLPINVRFLNINHHWKGPLKRNLFYKRDWVKWLHMPNNNSIIWRTPPIRRWPQWFKDWLLWILNCLLRNRKMKEPRIESRSLRGTCLCQTKQQLIWNFSMHS